MPETLKPTICLGRFQRTAPLDPADVAGTKIGVRSQAELNDALNRAWSSSGETVVVLEGGRQFDIPDILGRTRAAKISIVGDPSHGLTPIRSDSFSVLQVYSSARHLLGNVWLDGRNYRNSKGLVIGATHGGATNGGAVDDFTLHNVKISHVKQQLLKWSHNSTGLTIRGLDLMHAGVPGGDETHTEAFYGGEGSNPQGHMPVGVDAEDVYIAHTASGEAFDCKVNLRRMRLDRFEFEGVRHDYGAALTLGVDNSNGGHGRDNDYQASNGYLHDVHSGRHNVAAIEVGTGARLSNILIDNINRGDGLRTLRQAKGPNTTLHATKIVIGRVGGQAVAENGSNLSNKSQAVSPLTMIRSNVRTALIDGSLEASADYVFGDSPTPVEPVREQIRVVERKPGEFRVQITARGTAGDEVVRVVSRIDGNVLGEFQIGKTPTTVTVDGVTSLHGLSLHFVNDGKGTGGKDRNVAFEQLVVEGDGGPIGVTADHPELWTDAGYDKNGPLVGSNADVGHRGRMFINGRLEFRMLPGWYIPEHAAPAPEMPPVPEEPPAVQDWTVVQQIEQMLDGMTAQEQVEVLADVLSGIFLP